MSLREALNKHPALGLAAIIVVLAIVGALVYWQVSVAGRPSGVARGEWYYDLSTGKLFRGDPGSVPPIAAPSGDRDADGRPVGVRARVFSCGACTEREWFIGYLQTLSADGQQARADLAQIPEASEGGVIPGTPLGDRILDLQDRAAAGDMIASPEAPTAWMVAYSPEAQALRDQANRRCGPGLLPTECYP